MVGEGQHRKNGERVSKNWDTVFNALSSEPRRQLVVSLLDVGPDRSVPLPESAMMPNVPSDLERLRQELYHVHLPMLSDRKFITWETEPFVASRGSKFDQVAVVLEVLQAESTKIPDPLVIGCQRLEEERQDSIDV